MEQQKLLRKRHGEIKHYLVDFVSPNERYTVSNFKHDAEKAINEILSKGKIPIIVGGTGLYLNSLVYGIDYPEMEFNEKYRDELMEEASTEEGLKRLYLKAKEIDEIAMEKISENDAKRIVRILEIFNATKKTKTQMEIESKKGGIKYDFRKFAIEIEREKLYERINKRVDIMLEKGLVQEVKDICEKYDSYPTAMQALGYKEVVEYLENKLTYEEMVEKIKQETRRYAKRQLTWFRKNHDYKWLNGLDETQNNVNIILEEINE